MILVADSGATKTDWLIVDHSGRVMASFQSSGINPMIQTEDQIRAIIQGIAELKTYESTIQQVHFFGAGCSSKERNLTIQKILQGILPQAKIEIEHDLSGAIIALCGDQPGFACILGTGSNVVLFNGQSQIKKVPSLGWALGDEGSGAWFGKILLRDFCYDLLPEEMALHLKRQYDLNKDGILETVYKKPAPNRFLAGFMPVLSQFRSQEYVQQILRAGFDDFVKYQITCYEHYTRYPANFVGSVAIHFKEELLESCLKFDLQTNKFIQKPIEHIAAYLVNKRHLS